MNKTFILATALAPATPGLALAIDNDVDRSSPATYVKDSAITAKVKTKLAAEQLTSVAHIKVDTDADGVVWLTGTTRSSAAAARAEAIARNTDGVRDVKNHLVVKADE